MKGLTLSSRTQLTSMYLAKPVGEQRAQAFSVTALARLTP